MNFIERMVFGSKNTLCNIGLGKHNDLCKDSIRRNCFSVPMFNECRDIHQGKFREGLLLTNIQNIC